MAFKSDRPEDFEQLVLKNENRIYKTALAVIGNVQEAEDVTQEVFLRAYLKAPEFENQGHETAWLMRVTVNLCKSRLRQLTRRKAQPLTEEYPAENERQQELMQHVMELRPKYRAAVHLFYYEGYQVKEIAEIMGTREGTVKSLLSRGRQMLKEKLREEHYEGL